MTAAVCSSAFDGNAADVEAHAAERRIALDQHRLHAEVGGAERRRIAARAGAEHQHVAFDVGAPAGRSGIGALARSRPACAEGGDSGLQCQDQASGTDLVPDADGVPAEGDGTSIDALRSVISGSSGLTLSPARSR
jgi:hypothetical protein